MKIFQIDALYPTCMTTVAYISSPPMAVSNDKLITSDEFLTGPSLPWADYTRVWSH